MAKTKIIRYKHHGKMMSVIEKDKEQHAEHCLCWQQCKFFKLYDRKNNCEIANELFEFDKKYSVVTPVWECANYEKKEE